MLAPTIGDQNEIVGLADMKAARVGKAFSRLKVFDIIRFSASSAGNPCCRIAFLVCWKLTPA